MVSDAVLVARTLNWNDQQAFTRLVLRHELMVRSIDDVVQETFLRAYLSLASFRSESKFSTWLYRIAFNLVADKFRRKSLDYGDLDSIESVSDNCKLLQQSDLRKDLDKAMRNISAPQRIAVRLCLEEGYTHADAAMAMNLPLGTVKTHVFRGRAQLQQLLIVWGKAG
jgi:RNA polymerase sigma factor (sigma-70 family)